MKAPQGGYTLLEVTLFLAISSIIFVTTILAFRGQYATNEFITSMNDVNSKIKQYINDVNNGYNGSGSAGTLNYRCNIIPAPAGRPTLLPGFNSDTGTNEECIFLGKVFHFSNTSPNENLLHVYSVLGRRTYNSGGQVILVDSLSAANPTPAVGWPPPNAQDLTETYNIPRGAHVIYATNGAATPGSVPPTNNQKYLGGFFTSLNNVTGPANVNGNTNIIAVQYPYPASSNNNPANAPNSNVIDCIEFKAPYCNNAAELAKVNPFAMSNWTVCFASNPDGNRALIRFSSNAGFGVQTNLTIGKRDVC
jgi:hypothetical protein